MTETAGSSRISGITHHLAIARSASGSMMCPEALERFVISQPLDIGHHPSGPILIRFPVLGWWWIG
jgi:hypothetical protein